MAQYCKHCKVSAHSQPEWVEHLSSSAHLTVMDKTGRVIRNQGDVPLWERCRTLMLSNCGDTSASSILEYLFTWGPVEDFSYLPKLKRKKKNRNKTVQDCFALMKSKHTAFMISNAPNPHALDNGKEINIQRRAGVAKPISTTTPTPYHFPNNNEQQPIARINGLGGECLIECVKCGLRAHSLEEWYDHLASKAHWKVTSLLAAQGLREWKSGCGIILKEVLGVGRKELLSWGRSWGHVSNIIYSTDKDYDVNEAFLLFQDPSVVQELLNFKEYIAIGEKRVVIDGVSEFAGFSKKEKQKLREEAEQKNLQELSEKEKKTKNTFEKMTEFCNLMEGKEPKEQLNLFLEKAQWPPKEVTNNLLNFIRNILTPAFSHYPTLKRCKLFPLLHPQPKCGQTETDLTINVLLFLQGENLLDWGTQKRLVLQLRDCLNQLKQVKPCSLKPSAPTTNNSTSYFPLIFSFNVGGHLGGQVILYICSNTVPFHDSLLIQKYVEWEPRVGPLLNLVIEWNYCWSILPPSPKDLIPHQMTSMMLIFFLIYKKILPLPNLLENAEKPKLHYLEDPDVMALSVLGLLKNFYKFVGELEMEKVALSINLGKIIPKEAQKEEVCPLVLLDPFLPYFNIAASRSRKLILFRFQPFARRAGILLEEAFAKDTPTLQVIFQANNKWVKSKNDSLIN